MLKGMMTAVLLLISTISFAKDWQVQMLNYGKEGGMVFEPSFIHAKFGDTVTFIPTHRGHLAQSYVVPEGEQQWKSLVDKTYTVSLNNEGVHFYYCPPHLMMGMVGMIQVGAPLNAEGLKTQSDRIRSKVALKPERVDALLQQIIYP